MGGKRVLALAMACVIAATFGAVGVSGQDVQPQAKNKLKATVEYKGAGKVDKDHRIWIWVFDNPTIDASSIPVAVNTLAENGAAVTFEALPDTVYIALAYDDKGGYDGTAGPPPSGTPVYVYGDAGVAKGIKTGPDATVQITFDDSFRMP